MNCLALVSELQPTGDSLPVWQADMEAEGWTVTVQPIPATARAEDVHALIVAAKPDHVQMFGGPTFQVMRNADGHGMRPGDCDAPYCTDDLSAWQPQPDGSYASSTWPTNAVRTISRIDTTGLPTDALEGFQRAMRANHDYHSGAWEPEGGVIVNYLGGIDASIQPRLLQHLGAIARDVTDATGAYPTDTFCQSYAGKSWLAGALFGGGDPFRQADGYQGHIYYTCRTADLAAGSVRFGLLLMFCSYGWEFNRWPLQRAAVVGGSLAVLYDPYAMADLSAWSETVTNGEALRAAMHRQGYQSLDTYQGDGALRRRAIVGVSQADFDALKQEVMDLAKRMDAIAIPVPIPSNTAYRASFGPVAVAGWQQNAGILQGKVWPDKPVNRAIDVSGPNCGPAALYQQYVTNPASGGSVSVSVPLSAPGKIRLHFCESWYAGPGFRKVDVVVAGSVVLSAFDVFTAAGGAFKGFAQDFDAPAGSVTVELRSVGGSYPLLCGVEAL